MKKMILAALMAVGMLTAHADEGMWVLHHIDPRTLSAMQQLGLQLSGKELYDPESGTSLKDAVVDFGDFCSGVVVSSDGLVFTNHHCGYSSIQALSTTDDDILKNGFVAHSFAEERPAEGLSVFFLQRTDDVTERVENRVKETQQANPSLSHSQALSQALSQVQVELETQNPQREVRLQGFYANTKFYASIYKEYRDIRLVFTPTETLGKFGGDTDNWMWPRQTSDFSVFRVYADKNGEPAPYSPDNVPLHPKRWAKVSLDGYAPGDYCMTIGYPGSTSRYLSSYGIQQRIEQQNKPRIEVRGLKQDVWKKWMKQDRSVGIKYASKFAGSSNYWKNSIGMNQALEKLGVIAEKRKLEHTVAYWLTTQPKETQKRFDGMLVDLRKGYEEQATLMKCAMYYSEVVNGIEIGNLVDAAHAYAVNKDSADADTYLTKLKEIYKDYDARVDEETSAVLLSCLFEKIDLQYQAVHLKHYVDSLFNGDLQACVREVFSRSILVDQEKAIDEIQAHGEEALEHDPAQQFCVLLVQDYRPVVAAYRKLAPKTQYNEQRLTQALLEMQQDQPHYSDANFSMRLSYGIIQDYTADNHHFDYYTPSKSLLKKAAQQNKIEDYKLEKDIMQLIKKGDFGRYADKRTGDLQLCFLSNNDITGGNSGSPMFNGKGELIGLAFDGNWEAMSGDILFDPALQRCIGVDIRYVLFLIDKWGHADNLIQELGL